MTGVPVTNEEQIDALYDRLPRTESESERTELLCELRRLQQIEADRLIAEADARTSFRPDDALRAVDEARRLIAEHAAALDDAATNHR